MGKATIDRGEEMVQIPRSVFEKYIDFEEAMEDWIMSQDKDLIEKLRQAKRDSEKGKCVPWEQAKKQLDIA